MPCADNEGAERAIPRSFLQHRLLMIVSVIICTRNRAEHLGETLRSLSRVQVPAGLDAEFVVVDNASTDGTAAMVAEFSAPNMPLRLVRESRPGQSRARNAGLAATRSDLVLFTDDDLRFPVDWLEVTCRLLRSGAADAIAGGVTLAPHLERPWMEPIHRHWLAATGPDAPGRGHDMVGANMAFRRAVLERVPGFDAALGPGALGFSDDTLFSQQLRAAGFRIVPSEAAVEHHFQAERLSRASLLDAARKRGETKAYVAHHWEHRVVRAPAARMAHKWLQVALWRRAHPQETAAPEGLPPGELYNLEAYHFYRRTLTERTAPRLYEKHALEKRGGLSGED